MHLARRMIIWFVGALLMVVGAALAAGGGWLLSLGGSPYYLFSGICLTVAGWRLANAKSDGGIVFFLLFAATILWAVWEVGTDFWQLVPRVAPFVILSLFVLLALDAMRATIRRAVLGGAAFLMCVAMLTGGVAMFYEHGVISGQARTATSRPPDPIPDWRHFGRTPFGTRFVEAGQITPANVRSLKIAWIFRTGDISKPFVENQNTPLQVGNTLYVCTPRNIVIALQADSGKQIWRFDPRVGDPLYSRCRGLAFHESAKSEGGECARRILETTVQAQLIALDADTGRPCSQFGKGGFIDLKVDIGEVKPGYYIHTSAPTVARGIVMVGAFAMDGRADDMPGGVIRAYDVESGKLSWAWDPGNPDGPAIPQAGKSYSRSTPDMWSTPAFDEKLGLVYFPLGNGANDFWGADRSKATERLSTAIVALDIRTGREKWAFQTVHHDLWDYDLASQPALHDIPDGKGGTVPALIQMTKRGQIFLLDRRNGRPLARVEERAVPVDAQPGEHPSPTQPFSVGMPQVGNTPLTEASMWGATFFDQLACRIAFRRLRYLGEFTAPTTRESLLYPGYYGGMNWGGATIDPSRDLLIFNDIRMPQIVRLVPRADVDTAKVTPTHSLGLYPQLGSPYASSHEMMMSPLGIPCNAPPWGTMTAIDLRTRKIVWQRPLGTIKDSVLPSGIRSTISIPLGMPTLGGPTSTSSGLIFYAGTQDYYLRALDSRTGAELWKGRLPVGTQATPITFVSPRDRRQYVVVSAGGARLSPDRGDYVVAFRLAGQ